MPDDPKPTEPVFTEEGLPPEKPRVSVREHIVPPDKPEDMDSKKRIDDSLMRTKAGINYTAAFVMIASGTATMAEISRAWKIPYEKLMRRNKAENWGGLIRRYGQHFMPKVEAKLDDKEIKEKAVKIQRNRDITITAAQGVMKKIQKILDDNAELGLDTETIVNLSRAIKMLGEITMVAHGDEYAVRTMVAPNSSTKNMPDRGGPLIQINMPNMVSGPRKVKQISAVMERATKELMRNQPDEVDPATFVEDLNDDVEDEEDGEDFPGLPEALGEKIKPAELVADIDMEPPVEPPPTQAP